MANRNFPNSRIYTGHVMPVLLDCNFIVDSTNANGLGIRSLKGPFVQNVFMHTTQTPGAGNSNPASPGITVTNPNPQAGIIVVQLMDNYNRLLTGSFSVATPLGSSISINTATMTVGHPYVITSLGTATATDWATAGVPAGITPAVGVAFIAIATSAGGVGTATVAPPAAAGSAILNIESIGDSNTMIAPLPSAAQGFGAEIIFQCMSSSANANVLTAPADSSVISLSFLLSNSSVLVQGE